MKKTGNFSRTGTGNRLYKTLALAFAAATLVVFLHQNAAAQEGKPMVRIAKIIVDSASLPAYRAALTEGIEKAVKTEPGVLSMSAVYDKNNPTHVTVLEVYASEDAYKAHLQTPHFKKYKSATLAMVKSLELTDVVPIAFAAKPNLQVTQ
ncbi:MAG TPA: antibiotic biosynthesis monooxygenase family protein [Chitinophagaceae bacterium]|nr:antibiotic biosynthesis monooxygenase family protein [Chitinophagaceae bacterium]